MLSAILTGRGFQKYLPQTDSLATYFHGLKIIRVKKKMRRNKSLWNESSKLIRGEAFVAAHK